MSPMKYAMLVYIGHTNLHQHFMVNLMENTTPNKLKRKVFATCSSSPVIEWKKKPSIIKIIWLYWGFMYSQKLQRCCCDKKVALFHIISKPKFLSILSTLMLIFIHWIFNSKMLDLSCLLFLVKISIPANTHTHAALFRLFIIHIQATLKPIHIAPMFRWNVLQFAHSLIFVKLKFRNESIWFSFTWIPFKELTNNFHKTRFLKQKLFSSNAYSQAIIYRIEMRMKMEKNQFK